ncbi:MAG: SBBP repeat-containing protein [Acidobacteriia bacterium]|nr:SBBP repeat-containing protein [Terriglobia bacterium]
MKTYTRSGPAFLYVAFLYLVPAGLALGGISQSDSKTTATLVRLPLTFELNRGQSGPAVRFVSHGLSGAGYTLFLTEDGAVFEFPSRQQHRAAAVLRMKLVGARPAQISGAGALPGRVNYFIGNDPKKWLRGVPAYGKVNYKLIYPGIDLVYYGTDRQLEYDFVVGPGADPRRIALEFPGATPKPGAHGELQLAANDVRLALRKPTVYQMIDHRKTPVAAGYKLDGGRVQFALGAYDRSQPLVIDPVLAYMTYLGGAGGATVIGASQTSCAQCNQQNPAQGVAVDQAGNLYVTGYTTSTQFPLQKAYQSQVKGNANQGIVFVTEINPTAGALVYSTYLGGSVYDRGSAIAVDSSGSAYITGQAWSPDFPVTKGAYQTLCAPTPGPNNSMVGGCSSASNAFLTKLAPGGGSLAYSTFLGASHQAWGNAVAVDSQGRAYVAGFSNDQCDNLHLYRCFPETANALLPESLYNNTINPLAGNPGAAFVAVFDAAGANLLYSTLYGDKNPSKNANNTGTVGTGVAVDPSGNFYLTGFGQDPQLPTTAGAFQPTGTNNQSNGGIAYRGFVAKFSPVTGIGTGASFLYGTYLGGTATNEYNGAEQVSGIAVDASGNAYITGYTQSYDFPVTPGANDTNECGPATYECQGVGFLTKLNPLGTGLVWSTLVGPSSNVIGGTMNLIGAPRLDAAGNVYITGQGTYNYPVVNPLQPAAQDLNGGVFVTKYDPTGSTISFSTVIYSPSAGAVYPGGIDVDSQGNIYVAGGSTATDLPVTSGVFEPVCTGCVSRAGFLAKINPATVPIITEVDNAFSNIANSPIQSGTWVAIKGRNLSNTSPGRGWNANENFPTHMDGTSVTINGKPAFLYYISPTQVNVQAPSDNTLGPVSVVVTNNGANSTPFTATYQTDSPALLQWGGGQYPYALITDGATFIGNSSAVPGTVSAHTGESLTLWATGLGPTNPPLPAGQQPTVFPPLNTAPTVTVGGISVTVQGAVLRYAGLYQINIQLPLSLTTGDLPIQIIQGSFQSPGGVLINIQP